MIAQQICRPRDDDSRPARRPRVFDQIDDGLDELKEIGAWIIRHGAEIVRFSAGD